MSTISTIRLTVVWAILGCLGFWLVANSVAGKPTPQPIRYEITYYDRNGDGKVDKELHHAIGWADADFALFDNDFDGRYELKITCGAGIIEEKVDLPVPSGVKITRGR